MSITAVSWYACNQEDHGVLTPQMPARAAALHDPCRQPLRLYCTSIGASAMLDDGQFQHVCSTDSIDT